MTTYYVDTVLGDDANAGTAEGAGNAWATIDKAMNTVAAGDKVWVKASGTYAETPVWDTAGANTSPIIFEGYTSTTGDNGKVTIDGTGNTNCMTSSLGAAYYIFRNFKFDGATSVGVAMATTDNCTWFNCEFTNNGAAGMTADNNHFFYNCTFANNSGAGIDADANMRFIGCLAYGNGADNLKADSVMLMYKTVSYNPGTNSDCANLSAGLVVASTFDADNITGSDCVYLGTDLDPLVIDCILYDAAGNGATINASIWSAQAFVGYNLVNDNGTDYSQTGENIGIQDVTSAPAFTDEANDDYTLDLTSPAKNAGIQPGGIT